MTNLFSRFVKEEDGATAIEYGLIAALLSIAIVGTLSTLGDTLDGAYTEANSEIQAAMQ